MCYIFPTLVENSNFFEILVNLLCDDDLVLVVVYTTLAWAFKGATQGHIARVISWECCLLMALMPNQFKDTVHFDSLY